MYKRDLNAIRPLCRHAHPTFKTPSRLVEEPVKAARCSFSVFTARITLLIIAIPIAPLLGSARHLNLISIHTQRRSLLLLSVCRTGPDTRTWATNCESRSTWAKVPKRDGNNRPRIG